MSVWILNGFRQTETQSNFDISYGNNNPTTTSLDKAENTC